MTKNVPIRRGEFGNSILQNAYLSFLADTDRNSPGATPDIRTAYLLYLCKRKSRLLRLTGAEGTRGLSEYCRYASERLFYLFGSSADRSGPSEARIEIGRCYIDTFGSDGFETGSGGRSSLGEGTTLGTRTAWAAPLLDIHLMAGVEAWHLLSGNSEALHAMIESFELMVPLPANFRIWFSARMEERNFLLPREEGSRVGEHPPVVGVNAGI